MNEFTWYRSKMHTEFRRYIPGEVLPSNVRVFPKDVESGSPKEGDMIGRYPLDHDIMCLVPREQFENSYVLHDGAPMETAPRDGSPIWVYAAKRNLECAMRWAEDSENGSFWPDELDYLPEPVCWWPMSAAEMRHRKPT
jgi:hypothetical protein